MKPLFEIVPMSDEDFERYMAELREVPRIPIGAKTKLRNEPRNVAEEPLRPEEDFKGGKAGDLTRHEDGTLTVDHWSGDVALGNVEQTRTKRNPA